MIRRTRHAEIAGAGFAGLAAATALRQRGWSVTVHEANAQLREIGAGIFMWENGLKALAEIGGAAAVLPDAFRATSSDVRVDGVAQSSQPTNTPDTYPMLTMSRQYLYESILALATAAGVEIHTSSRATGADARGLLLEDGTHRPADLVIAADGAGSAVRASLPLKQTRRKFNYGITRLLASRRGTEGEAWDKVIDFWRMGTYARRVLYVPCSPTTAYLAMMSILQDEIGTAIPVQRSMWREEFPELAPLFEQTEPGERFDAYESSRHDRWTHGCIALVGDAAHAMPPTLGQGAGCAIMNAVALANVLDAHGDVAQGLLAWEAQQRPFTESIQTRAEEFAEMGPKRSMLGKAELGRKAVRTEDRQPAVAADAALAQGVGNE